MQAQLVTRLERIEREEEKITSRSRYKFQSKMAKPLLFDRDLEKIADFVIVCKLYIRMKIKEKIVKEQVN